MGTKIGCAALVYDDCGHIVGFEGNRERGVTLPGGKWEEHETFKETVLRELREETGLVGRDPKLVFQLANTDGYYVLVFRVYVDDWSTLNCDGSEKGGVLATVEDLMTSKFKAYYELLFDAVCSGPGRCSGELREGSFC